MTNCINERIFNLLCILFGFFTCTKNTNEYHNIFSNANLKISSESQNDYNRIFTTLDNRLELTKYRLNGISELLNAINEIKIE